MSIRVLLADDHVIVRQGVRALLEREGFLLVGEASDGHEALQLAASTRPDVAVLDFAMPSLNGLDVARQISKVSPGTRSILLTVHNESRYVLDAFRAGARGYVLKTQAGQDLVRAVREVHKGSVYLSPGISETVVDACLGRRELPVDPLTARERQVLQLVAEGHTTKEVATYLNVGVKTAESYRIRVMRKLDIHHTAGLVRYAIKHGLLLP
jgi:DNA-binding NarL/FixJ family response regulator